MLIVDSQIHIWENAKMSAHHRQIPTYSVDDALKEMAGAGVEFVPEPQPLGQGGHRDGRQRAARLGGHAQTEVGSMAQHLGGKHVVRDRHGVLLHGAG